MPIFDSKKVTVIFVLGGPGAGKYPPTAIPNFAPDNAVKVKVHNVRDSSTISISLICQVYFLLFLAHQHFLELFSL